MAAVPKILHQTWKTTEIPAAWQRFVESWGRMHPKWEHRIWTDEANRKFVEFLRAEVVEQVGSEDELEIEILELKSLLGK